MFSWNDLFFELHKLKQGHIKDLGTLDFDVLLSTPSFGVVTFRVGCDGVARMIASRTRSIRKKRGKPTITLITGGIKFWNQHDLCDQIVLDPLLGLDNQTSKEFFALCVKSSVEPQALAERIWNEANVISERITRAVDQNGLTCLFVDNINSLPYNICAALAVVLASEKRRIPVLNVCHDFYWEHHEGTRAKFCINTNDPLIGGFLKILCPWSSPLWLQVTTTRAAQEWLLSRGRSTKETAVIPYGMEPPQQDSGSAENFLRRLDCIPCQTHLSPQDIQSEIPLRLSSSASAYPGNSTAWKKRWIVTIPTKISSGKKIHSGIRTFHAMLQQRDVQDLLTKTRLIATLVVAGPYYDVSEDAAYLDKIVDTLQRFLFDYKFSSETGLPVEVFFLKGLPAPESTSSDVTMRDAYGGTDIVLFCSERETWGLPILDSAHFGLPMIATKYCGNHVRVFEEVTRGLTVFQIENDENNVSIRPSTAKAITSPEFLAALKLHNSRHACRHFDDSLIAVAVEEAMSKLVSNINAASMNPSETKSQCDSEWNSTESIETLASLLIRKSSESMRRPYVVALLAPPGWGKTSLSQKLVKHINENTNGADSSDTLSLDDFGLTQEQMVQLDLSYVPESLRIKDLLRRMKLIKQASAVPVPRFVHGTSIRRWRIARALRILLVEGIFTFWRDGEGIDGGRYEDLQEMIDTRIYIRTDTSSAIAFLVQRDMERSMNTDRIIQRLGERQMQVERYVLPFENEGDIIVTTGDGDSFRSITDVTEKKPL